MPSHKIHLCIAKEINKKLKLNNDAIMLGSVLPDLTIEHDHGLSHFQFEDVYPKNLANADEFIKKYPTMKDDISIGYIIHLLTDKYYNDIYYHTNIEGIEHNKYFKHNLFDSYDKYLLKHGIVDKINNKGIINNIPNYKDISFDNNYLNEYIDKLNNDIDSINIENDYTIDYQVFLDDLYNGCIKYIEEAIYKYK